MRKYQVWECPSCKKRVLVEITDPQENLTCDIIECPHWSKITGGKCHELNPNGSIMVPIKIIEI